MIIRRYLVKQVVSTALVVIAILTLIMMGSRLIRYFGFAAQGRFDPSILFSIVAYRLPEFLTLILPLGLFIALMLVFGRLYTDHEMAVFNSSGISRHRLGRLLVPLAVVFFVIHAILMLWLSPWGLRQFEQLTATQAVRAGFDLVRPKEFVTSGPYTIYAGDLSEDRKNLQDIFFYQRSTRPDRPDVIILAKQASRVEIPNDTANVVDLIQGRRYTLYPGQAQYSQAEFASYRLRLESEDAKAFTGGDVESYPWAELWKKRQQAVVQSEIGWRIFVPFSIFLSLLLAVALCEVNPRQGRYLRLFPALMIFASLIVALMAIKTRVSKAELGVWAYPLVLIIYAVVGAIFSRKQKLAPKIKKQIQRVTSS